MARINFEDDVEAQDEFWALLPLVGGDRIRALGKLILFFRIAQKAHGYDEPMSEELLRSKDFGDMIESGWAVPVDGGYQALGAEKHFGWYRQKVQAGYRGGRPKKQDEHIPSKQDERISGNRSVPAANRTVPAANPNANPNANPLALAPSPALSLSQEEEGEARARARDSPPGGCLLELWQKHSGPLEKCTSVSPTRAAMIRNRLEENPDPAYWEGLIKKMASSPFFNGKNKIGWKATFGWFIRPGKHEDIAEGSYESGIDTEIDWSKLT